MTRVAVVVTVLATAHFVDWLAAAVVLGGIVTFVHFVGARAETPAVILASYDNAAAGVPAVFVTFAILLGLVVMAFTAIDVARRSRRWW